MNPKNLRTPVRRDERGIYVVTNNERHRPGGIVGYEHAYAMDDSGLKEGDRVWARHISQSPLARVTRADGRTVIWASDYMHERYGPQPQENHMSTEQELIRASQVNLDLPGLKTLSIEEFVNYFVAEIEKRDDVVELVAEIQTVGLKVAECVVTSAEQFEASGADLNTIRRLAKSAEEKRMAITRPIDGLKKRVMDIFAPHTRLLNSADDKVAGALGKYSRELKQRIAAAQAKADQEAREKREKLEAKAREEEAKGRTERAEALTNRAAEVAAKPVAVTAAPTKAAGLKPRTEWKFEVTDASKLPEEYKIPNLVAIGQVVRALKKATNIAGVRVWEEDAFSAARK